MQKTLLNHKYVLFELIAQFTKKTQLNQSVLVLIKETNTKHPEKVIHQYWELDFLQVMPQMNFLTLS